MSVRVFVHACVCAFVRVCACKVMCLDTENTMITMTELGTCVTQPRRLLLVKHRLFTMDRLCVRESRSENETFFSLNV